MASNPDSSQIITPATVLLEGSICDTDVDNDDGDLEVNVSQSVSKDRSNIVKRKASPLYKTGAKRTTTACKPKCNQSFSESLVTAFKNPYLIETIAPLLQTVINPAIQSSIQAAVSVEVKNLQSGVFSQLLETTAKLHDTVEKQVNVIYEQRSKLEQLSHECNVKSKLVDDLQSKVVKLSEELDSMKVSLNDIEQ